MQDTQGYIQRLQGPILVLGASGFVGANLFQEILRQRADVFATCTRMPSWRLDSVPMEHIFEGDLTVHENLSNLLQKIKPQTIFDCTAYGAYSFETEGERILQVNTVMKLRIIQYLENNPQAFYVHAGSSSEYGDNSAGPSEDDPRSPNSIYSVSKSATADLLSFYGSKKKVPCVNLRLYSVYGPLEDSSRLIPNLIKQASLGQFPKFVDPRISRDFVYIDDVTRAFILAPLNIKPEHYGRSINIGYGQMTTIADLAKVTKETFSIAAEPEFNTMAQRSWDVQNWYANVDLAKDILQWTPQVDLRAGLQKFMTWYKGLSDTSTYEKSSKLNVVDRVYSVTAIVACYKDNQAVPIMYERLTATFQKLGIDYEIIFVNDCSPDNTEEIILDLSRKDPRVVGVSHTRNFGSQAAFRSGMEISKKNACVLMDGDLQDPPEVIEEFVAKWKQGYDVINGIRIKREAPFYMQFAYKAFYRVFRWMSYVNIPRDAGDFSLIDRKVVRWILAFPERDLFLRGIRAYVGFKQIGVSYVRPERMFGRTTNNLFKNIGWAKKAIFSFSNKPLNSLSGVGLVFFIGSLTLIFIQMVVKLFFPDSTPRGLSTLIIAVVFFGSVNLLGISLIGEYIAKIFEETKQRPHFIRKGIIRAGKISEPVAQTVKTRG